MHGRSAQFVMTAIVILAAGVPPASAQAPQAPMDMDMTMDMSTGWRVMQDAVVLGMFNHQGGPRGGDEFKAPNWWMGMFSRKVKSSQLTFNTMLSLDPATLGKKGYREIFQAGETADGRPLIDHQHPHDFFMQLAGIWRTPLTARTALTIAGAAAGEPALGPIAFMHRASAMENPFAPLSHHTFDSTHIAFGVVTAALDRGAWTIEGSAFNAREPDEDRWDIDFGALDSVAGRVWFRPTPEWEFQVSSAHLREPEELEEGDIERTTASGSWLQTQGGNFSAVTVGYGRNNKIHGAQNSLLAEGTRRSGLNSIYGRLEAHQLETALLATGSPSDDRQNTVLAFTIGGVRDVLKWRGLEGGIGAGVTFYGVPEPLTVTHGDRPVSFQVFLRFRPLAGPMGRMWNMQMTKPMSMPDEHAGHQMN